MLDVMLIFDVAWSLLEILCTIFIVDHTNAESASYKYINYVYIYIKFNISQTNVHVSNFCHVELTTN